MLKTKAEKAKLIFTAIGARKITDKKK